MGQPLIGRDEIRAQLADSLDDARAGRGGVLWLTGEAGIGKTRLLTELGDLATGMTVLRGSGWEDAGTPAFWIWTQVLRGAAEITSATDWAPEAASLLTGEFVPKDTAGRFPLFDAVSTVITGLGDRGPTVLLLDDLHWADQGSLRLLRFLVPMLAGSRVLVACGWRAGEADLGDDVAEILARSRSLELVGLAEDEVAALIEAASGLRVEPEDALAVAAQTAGNPLFVLEMARLAAARGTSSVAGTVPATATATIRRRIGRVSQPANDVLVALAVAGPVGSVELLGHLLGRDPDAVADSVDELVGAGLITVDAEPPTFTHALIRATVEDELQPGRRRALHLAVADHLEGRATSAQLAHHLFGAMPLVPVERVAAAAEDAARTAVAMQAFEDAAAIYTRLLDLRTDDPAERSRLLLARGECLLAAGDLETARPSYTEAAELARATGDAAAFARAALGFAAGLSGFEVRLGDRAQLDLLEEALARLPELDAELRAYVLSRLSVAAAYSETPERRGRLADEAVAMARRLGSQACLAHALAAHCDTIAGPADAERREQEASEIITLARAERDRGAELLGLRLRIVARLEHGDAPGAEADMRTFARLAAPLNQPIYGWYVPLWQGYLAQVRGDFDGMRAHADEAGRIGALADSHNAIALSLTQHMWLDNEYADVPRLRAYLDRMYDEVPEMVPIEQTVFSMFPGQPDHVRRAFLPRLGDALAQMPHDDSEWLSYLCHTTTAMFEGNDDGAYATLVYDELLPHRDRYVVDGIAATSLGSVERSLGMLASLTGARELAADHFARALEADQRVGSVAHAPSTHRAHGVMYLRADDPDAARPHLQLARDAYASLKVASRVAEIDELLGDSVTGELPDVVAAGPAAFRQEGAVWRLDFRGRSTSVRHSKGMADLAVLLARPRQEVHALDLVGTTRAPAEGDLGPVLDDVARAAYKLRITELDELIAAGDEAADLEREALLAELSSAFGLGGRARRTGSAAERARSTVTRRIRDAIGSIENAHPELGRHLRASVRTGTFCSYEPELEQTWITV